MCLYSIHSQCSRNNSDDDDVFVTFYAVSENHGFFAFFGGRWRTRNFSTNSSTMSNIS